MIRVSTELEGQHRDWDIFDEAMGDLEDYLEENDDGNAAQGSFVKQVREAIRAVNNDGKRRSLVLPLGIRVDEESGDAEDRSHLDMTVDIQKIEE